MSILSKLRAMRDATRRALGPSKNGTVQPMPQEGRGVLERLSVLANRNNPTRAKKHAEIDRITALPVVEPMTKEELEAFNRDHVLAEVFNQGWRLFPPQANSILAYEEHGGLFGPIGVGWGKTLITLVIAHLAYKKGIKKSLLLVPPQVYSQLVDKDIRWARRHVTIGVPFLYMGRTTAARRRHIANSNRKGCYILPYSCMSTKDTSEVLAAIAPGLVILDEAHLVKNRRAARTKRLVALINKCKPEVVALSGTITSKSIRDYHHLIKTCLQQNCPLPIPEQLAGEWAQVLDADVEYASRSQTGPILPLVRWAHTHFPGEDMPYGIAGFRKAYKLRLTSTPGVVATGDSEIGVSLTLSNTPVDTEVEGWDELKRLIKQVVDEWKTPNGDEIDHAIHTFKWLHELSCGFYNRLYWPSPTTVARRAGLSEADATDLLKAAKMHHEALQIYHKDLRKWLGARSRPGLDTPMLVGADMAKHGDRHVGSMLYGSWSQAREIEKAALEQFNLEELPERDSEAVRVCPCKINHAIQWVEAHIESGGIVWFYHQEIGKWLAEHFKNSIFTHRVKHCPAGSQYDVSIVDVENKHNVMIASITAHGTGKNLQHFQHQMYLQWPRSAILAEQSLGRTHRNGQEADELIVDTINTLDFDELCFAACLNDSLYIHQSTGQRQKLIYSNYDPQPKIVPSAVLRERGFENKVLNQEQQELLEEKFGT